jgi:hypothetical protein
MPHRLIVVAVVTFWLAANGWLVYREVWPQWRAGGPPPYTIDLSEELGNSMINWEIYHGKKKAGAAISQVERQRDATYRLRTQLYFDRFKILPLFELKKLSTAYHVTEEGDLLGLSVQFMVQMPQQGEHELELKGAVENREILPKLFFDGQPLPLGESKIPLSQTGTVLNPMQLVNRVPGLSEGRRWRMALFDPLEALGKALPGADKLLAGAEGMTVPYLNAEVLADTLWWNDEDVDCFKIEYRKPKEPEPVAATWVRRRDGLVLQQFSASDFMEMTIRRIPPR